MAERNRTQQRKVFLETNGPGPWPCYYEHCNEFVQPEELRVHHVDEDKGNNDPTNIVAIHHPCHMKLHHTGKHVSEETRRKLADAQRGKRHSAETRRKISEAGRGRIVSAETRAKMSAAHTGKPHPRKKRVDSQ